METNQGHNRLPMTDQMGDQYDSYLMELPEDEYVDQEQQSAPPTAEQWKDWHKRGEVADRAAAELRADPKKAAAFREKIGGWVAAFAKEYPEEFSRTS